MKNLLAFLFAFVLLSVEVNGQEFHYDTSNMKELFKKTYSPYAGRGYPRQVLWGDSHLHTALSMDAGAFGNRLGMDEAYKFARGEEVVASTGQRVKMGRPLDWLVVADHSDGMGFFPAMLAGESWVMEKEEGRRWRKMVEDGDGVKAALEIIGLFSQGEFPFETNDPEVARPIWKDVIAAAEKYNEPGKFTAFIGYEWTSLVKGNNLHRNVIFRDGGEKASTVLPYTLADSDDPEDLWEHLAEYEKSSGGKVLAIPHNGNLSNGMMFAETRQNGQPVDQDYAERRNKWEPVYEVTQIKGDGEAHPFLSPNDEFADYETWDLGNLDASQAKTNEMLPAEYGRSGLKRGLKFQHELGTNPFKFGMIGSTDSHTSLATAEEDNFFGKHAGAEPSKTRGEHPFMKTDLGTIAGWDMTSSGYAAVWATDNTREAIWDALARRECYATTGSRMLIRFFGGWDFVEADASTRLPGDIGYQKGVPMGGDLSNAPSGKAPSFLVAALKDPFSGNLDRVQIIKGWVDANGETQERIYDVAVSDDRKIGGDGRCKTAVGNTVDLEKAIWTNTIGDSEFIAVWTDPDFDPNLEAFYYVRVIEIPTPRWVLYDKVRLGAEVPSDVEMTTQERGYTSPIWYTPK